jgi:endoglucanase
MRSDTSTLPRASLGSLASRRMAVTVSACLIAAGISIPTAAVASSAAAAATNLLTGTEAAFNGTTGNWVALNDSKLSWAQAPSTLSTGSLVMTATSRAWIYAESPQVAAAPGTKYTAEAGIMSPSSASVADAVAFYNSSGALIDAVAGQSATAVSSWKTLPEAAAIAPSSATKVALLAVAWTASVGQRFYIESPVLARLPGTGSASVVGPLRTAGNQIVQANGQSLVLQGVNLAGLEYNGNLSGTDITEQVVAEAKAAGANFVRVPLGEQFWIYSYCENASGYASSVDRVVKWITSLGMVALLDLHTNSLGACQPGSQHNMADEAEAPNFWKQLGQRYGSPSSPYYNPLVAFDLYNEPHDISDATWLNGGQTTDTGAPQKTYQAAGMQQLYDAVRSTGSQNLVFISGLNWAGAPPTELVSGYNIVYADHCYTSAASDVTQDNLDLWTSLSASKPIVITEFGGSNPSDGTYNANVIAFAQAHDWGWSPWAFVGGGAGFDVATFLPDGTAEPDAIGIPVLLGLSGAGRPGGL